MRCLVLFFLLAISLGVNAQVKLLSYQELADRIAKGNDTTFVINFWATWCGPCVKELPNFEKLSDSKFKNPVKVILMSLDFKSKLNKVVVPFVKKHQLKSETYVVNEPSQQEFIELVSKDWSGALPATLLVNTKHHVRRFYEKEFTHEELKNTIENLK